MRAFDTEAIKDHGHQETRARVLDRPAEADERALWCRCCVTLGESSALWSLISPLDNEGIRDDFYGPFGSVMTLGFLLPSPCPLSGPRTHTVAMAERQSSGNLRRRLCSHRLRRSEDHRPLGGSNLIFRLNLKPNRKRKLNQRQRGNKPQLETETRVENGETRLPGQSPTSVGGLEPPQA